MQNRTKIGLATGANVIASLFTKLYYFSLNEINTMVSEFLAEKVLQNWLKNGRGI